MGGNLLIMFRVNHDQVINAPLEDKGLLLEVMLLGKYTCPTVIRILFEVLVGSSYYPHIYSTLDHCLQQCLAKALEIFQCIPQLPHRREHLHRLPALILAWARRWLGPPPASNANAPTVAVPMPLPVVLASQRKSGFSAPPNIRRPEILGTIGT